MRRCGTCAKPFDPLCEHDIYCSYECAECCAHRIDRRIVRRSPKSYNVGKTLDKLKDRHGVERSARISALCTTDLGMKLELARIAQNLTLLAYQRRIEINQEPYQKLLKGERVSDGTMKKALDAIGAAV